MTRHFTFDSKDFDDIKRTDLRTMTHEELEEWGWGQHELARASQELARVLANQLSAKILISIGFGRDFAEC